MKKLLASLFFLALLSACTQKIPLTNEIFTEVYSKNNLPSTKFMVASDCDTVLIGKSGTKLLVRKNTFVDGANQAIHGQIELELKEALSGIDMVMGNMTTTTNGEILQSGGMIFLNAEANCQQLFIAKDAAIQVSVPSQNRKDSMNIFSGVVDQQTQTLNWVNPQDLIQNPVPELVNSPAQAMEANDSTKLQYDSFSENQISENQNADLVEPELYSKSVDTLISLVFDTMQFPEIAQYRNVKFKLNNEPNFDKDDSKREWFSIDLEKSSEKGVYLMTFSGINISDSSSVMAFLKGKQIHKTYRVSPVFAEGQDYNDAMKVYEKKFKSYEYNKRKIAEKFAADERRFKYEQARAEEIAEFKRKKDLENQQREAQRNLMLAQQRGSVAGAINNWIPDPFVNYIFGLKNLGWSNIDALYHNPNSIQVQLTTQVLNFENYDQVYVSMYMKSENIYLPAYYNDKSTYRFAMAGTNSMFVPEGTEATIIATGYKNGEIFFGTKKIQIQSVQEIKIDMKVTDKDKLRDGLLETIERGSI